MKNIHWKSFSLGIVFILALIVGLGSVSAATTSITKNIKVTYNNIKVLVNGSEAKFGTDSSGNAIEPFIYNGTTYLPLRAVGKAVGQEINWDNNKKIAYVGNIPGVDYSFYTDARPYKEYNVYDRSNFEMGGVLYNYGFKFSSKDSYLYSNLQGKFSTLTFDVGTMYYEGYVTSKLNIYLDNKPYTTIKVFSNELPKKVSIPVKGVSQIRIDTAGSADNHEIGIGDPMLSVK